MSASLVGSEMCIRDRWTAWTRILQWTRAVHAVDAEKQKELRGGTSRQPVSYTHLTLPTICSV
eukprot:1212907-Alexandrium_andersonii.AAC.1